MPVSVGVGIPGAGIPGAGIDLGAGITGVGMLALDGAGIIGAGMLDGEMVYGVLPGLMAIIIITELWLIIIPEEAQYLLMPEIEMLFRVETGRPYHAEILQSQDKEAHLLETVHLTDLFLEVIQELDRILEYQGLEAIREADLML